ncbi:hypothetical protein AB0N17_45415 [Streptomyces sp. NPDC051133]|uniref:YncE family protein n=1 Tax=Streptomyces sp. NPDC051133 TaxID=3155521 RepID=UPI0034402132
MALPAVATSPAWATPGPNAYVTNLNSNDVSVIDTTTNTVADTIPVGNSQTGIAITPDGLHTYVTNSDSGNVSVIDTTTNTVADTIPVGNGPTGIAITSDGLHTYVTDSRSGNVSVIDTTTNTVVNTIPVGSTPIAVAITPAGKQLPSLTIAKGHTGHFRLLRLGTYTITVGNNGSGPTDGTTVTVHDTLPRGLIAHSISGTGWRCTRSTLTCTRSNTLAASGSYPPISLTVLPLRIGHVTNTATVTVTGGGAPATRTATDDTTITLFSRI